MDYPTKTVYLAGPITGLTYKDARFGWRSDFVNQMPGHIHCLSPMRGKEMLAKFGNLTSGNGYPKHPLLTPAAITTRDKHDLMASDLVITCFLDSEDISGGTFIEYGWADAFDIPVLGVGAEDNPNLQHIMARHILGWRVDTLPEAVAMTKLILTPGV